MASIEQFTENEIEKLKRGELVQVDGKRYRICQSCNQIVCLNKKLFGSWHFCDLDGDDDF